MEYEIALIRGSIPHPHGSLLRYRSKGKSLIPG